MKKYINEIIAIIITICFLSIQISYNGTPSVSVFSAFRMLVKNGIESSFDLLNFNFKTNYTYYLIEFLFISSLLFLSIRYRKYRFSIILSLLYLIIWFLWYIFLRPIIDEKLFVLTSLPFLVSLIGLLILLLSKSLSGFSNV
jgi:hypothetical protein